MKRSLIVIFVLALSAFSAEGANAQTVSAHGSGTVGGFSDCFTCIPQVTSSGGQGVSFNVSFSGQGTGSVLSLGTFTAVDRETNIQLTYSGPGVILPQNHILAVLFGGTCFLTTPDGLTEPAASCFVLAVDNSSNGRADEILFLAEAPNGDIAGCGGLGFFPCTKTPSGNINID